MYLRSADVDRYGPLVDCRPPCSTGLTVLSGPNEAGKTLYLEGLLKLLEPGIGDSLTPVPRVDGIPTGRVVLEHGGEQYECDGSLALSEITPIEPRHLQSIFVVQDTDLTLPSEQDYYTSLIEKLGDIHTSEIQAINAELKERGRLTPTELKISSDQSVDNAGDVRDAAADLAEEIREYAETVHSEGLDELESRRLRCKRDLEATRSDLDAQQDAKLVAEYDRLADHLETYRTTSEQLEILEEYDRETLERLRKWDTKLDSDRADRVEVDETIERTRSEIDETESELADARERQADLERRESAVENAKEKLREYRNREDEASGADRQLALSRPTAVVALLGAGIAGAAGGVTGSLAALGLGGFLVLVALLGLVSYTRANRRLTAIDRGREDTIRAARDAGLNVEDVESIGPAVSAFDRELGTVTRTVAQLEQKLDGHQADLRTHRRNREALEERIDEQETAIADTLAEAAVDSIEEYRAMVEERESITPERQTARQALVDRFGNPETAGVSDSAGGKTGQQTATEGEDPWEGRDELDDRRAKRVDRRAEQWERQLESMIEDVDREVVDAETYDETTLSELESTVDDLDAELEELETDLAEYHARLDEFEDRALDLDTTPFIDRRLDLDAKSPAGLRALATDLDAVVDIIETDAELSRKALSVFERIEEREEQKLTTLFDPNGPASRTFERLTGGRYTEVAYDADEHELVVERRDGRTFGPTVLSQGTRDQLYFATRVSLAQQLLGASPGFLLLDDPFLAADMDRLHEGFGALQDLADEGWQILYFTAKQEVSETMVDEYGLRHVEMDEFSGGI